METFEYYLAIEHFFSGLILWIRDLPTWGMIVFMILFSSVSSKFGILANIACGVLTWNLFGQTWGLLFLGAGAILLIIGFIIAAVMD
jgi:hypothetical protein